MPTLNSKLLLVNATANSGSTGRIVEEIGQKAIQSGFESWVGFGHSTFYSKLKTIKIGSKTDFLLHVLKSRLFDRHGFGSKRATRKFIEEIQDLDLNIINLHNIHGYYLNIEILIDFIVKNKIAVIWTFHDCWPITGHCSYFDRYQCIKWQSYCFECPNKRGYPTSWIIDRSKKNFYRKRELFNSIEKLYIVTPSVWMKSIVQQSFLKSKDVEVIYNGVDINIFRPIDCLKFKNNLGLAHSKIILGVASTWDARKGLDDFIRLSELIDERHKIILIGLSQKQLRTLPKSIIGISRTEDVEQLVQFYSMADVFVNPTYIDNFPTTNIEALACGTPVITYNTGGSPESIDERTGFVVERGDLIKLHECIKKVFCHGKEFYSDECRGRALKLFDKDFRYSQYVNLFNECVNV